MDETIRNALRRRRLSTGKMLLPIVAAGAIGIGIGVALAKPEWVEAVGCYFGGEVKGNISDRGERIYHIPGQRYFSETSINPFAGERRFCTEADARAAGWRRSLV